MNVRKESKKIVQYLLDEAIQRGNLRRETVLKYEELAEKLGFENVAHLKVCIQYLCEKELIITSESDGKRVASITSDAIDFFVL